MKEKFTTITSTCVPLPMENIDTDQIIPARFLKATSREGFGDNLFRDWRYDKEGNPIKDFVLNDPTYSGCILVAGPVVVSEEFLSELFDSIAAHPQTQVRVDLPSQTITNLATGKSENFDINPYKKQCLAEGLDDIEYLLSRKADIEAWEAAR